VPGRGNETQEPPTPFQGVFQSGNEPAAKG
jgi:hypothetical protein